MTKPTPNKYFIGKLDKVKRGSVYRIFRQRKTLLGNVIDEVCMKSGWRRIKAGYKKVGIFIYSQAAARADKRMYEGKK